MKTNLERATKIVDNFNLHTEGDVKVDTYGFLSTLREVLKDKGVPHKDRMEIIDLVNNQMREQGNFLD